MLPTPTHMPQLDELSAIIAQNTSDDGVLETSILDVTWQERLAEYLAAARS